MRPIEQYCRVDAGHAASLSWCLLSSTSPLGSLMQLIYLSVPPLLTINRGNSSNLLRT